MELLMNGNIVESLENKSILVTGSTGFLAKLFVEKVLRVQPKVKRFYFLLRETDATSASQRLNNEVIGKEVFRVIKETYCERFNSFILEKLTPVAGDTACENLGIQDSDLKEKIWKEVDVVANFAATTKFYERYDVALGTNTLGAKHVLDFANKCEKLEMLLHVSTAYVCGEKEGLILEKPFKMGETLNGTSTVLDIEAEVKLVEQRLSELKAKQVPKKQETEAMKEFGLQRANLFGWPNTYVFTKAMGEMLIGHLRGNLPVVILRPTIVTSTFKEPFPGWIEGGVRTVDSFIVNIGNGKLKCSLGNPKTILDAIPGDMVVNAAIVAMVSHAKQPLEFIYQVGSSKRAPFNALKGSDYAYHYFSKNPLMSKDGKIVKVVKPVFYSTMTSFRRYLDIKYVVPLKGLQLVNAIFCLYFGKTCSDKERKIKSVIRLVKFYKPYILFKGIFDDFNLEKLRMAVTANEAEANTFYFDPKYIDWEDYFMNIHIPGLVKYVIIIN